ncbi:MAG: response regulator [Thermoplasmatota archaeon]
MRPWIVLLVEDNPADARLMKEAIDLAGLPVDLHHVADGEEALGFLQGTDGPGKMLRPDLVLLDLNLPRLDGREVLRTMKDDASLRRIPVVVLTTSASPSDVRLVYDLHGNAFLTKKLDVEAFEADIAALLHHWFEVVELSQEP